jgi:hypothetical protein
MTETGKFNLGQITIKLMNFVSFLFFSLQSPPY